MEFILTFTKPNGKVLNGEPVQIGLLQLEEARKEIGYNFPAELMKSEIHPCVAWELNISLTEEQAKQTGLFLNKTIETVTVITNLNKFARKILHIKRNSKDDTILKVAYVISLDKQEVFESWIKAGCPLKWRV